MIWCYRLNKEAEEKNESYLEPSLTDYYIMQNTREIRTLIHVTAQDKAGLNKLSTRPLDDLRLKPQEKKSKEKQTNIDTQHTEIQVSNALAQATHLQRLNQDKVTAEPVDFKKWQTSLIASSSDS